MPATPICLLVYLQQLKRSNFESSLLLLIPLELQNHIVFSYQPEEFQEMAAFFYSQALFQILGMVTRSASGNRITCIPELTYTNERAL